jgi:hypothetical protein
VFTARYTLSRYIKEIGFVIKGLNNVRKRQNLMRNLKFILAPYLIYFIYVY